ncbi:MULTISPECIES: hypothetical protein [Okeania]|uniref:Restriction endonuclease subunit R n=1 Tax=Okeania hirsuta TaxID=1458930 RepID=A0A3N6P308_9CYAN|nr:MULTISPECIES: hypothetical protein [Okeania]NET11665.1 hypothetical protein [Okeania sp. SIO1H6]NES74651.1 hypothetical protein [Okeania sp. SIO1H4]NES87832.1 hypothetical protein [Okeania sp. SIO2B9]NET21942.1 hypothetical protein [Okeania sp. SIO1H5]NET74826.1 hypothetical protein [Okeania sp. SIO1F9]
MAFSDYKTIAQVQQEYKIKYLEADFIEITHLKPSDLFVRELKFSEQNMDIYTSEYSRCENIIYPILREVYKSFIDKYTLWSHKFITYDTKLNGAPDYLFSTKSELGKTVLGFPIVVVVEAKKNDFSEGWGQCLAELIAVQKLNKAEELAVYGIVTDGELWQFGKLVSDEFTKSKLRIAITDLDKIFGTISFLLSSKREAD